MDDWRSELDREFASGAKARAQHNEGRARVCARRAAGVAIQEALRRRGIRNASTSAIDLLNLLKGELELPADVRRIADHLTVRVTESFTLPVEADLLAEAQTLCRWLLPDWEK